MWNKEGLEFYYTVEKNWKEKYNDKAKFSVLINGWETSIRRGAETWGFHESSSYPHMYCFLAWRERIESTHKTHHVGTL
jgi:hypothetical protein